MPSLSENERHAVLQLARTAIIEAVSNGRILANIPNEGIFAYQQGVFVTLHIANRLRGCIGVVEPDQPLGDSVVRSAAAAALHDPRFPALRAEELADLQIEISLLSPPLPILPEQIQIGTHGLLISCGKQRGLLLPQVALEHHLNTEQFLGETCRKAGLPPGAWRQPETQVFGFTCEVFASDARV